MKHRLGKRLMALALALVMTAALAPAQAGDALRWAVEQNIVRGKDGGYLDPLGQPGRGGRHAGAVPEGSRGGEVTATSKTE